MKTPKSILKNELDKLVTLNQGVIVSCVLKNEYNKLNVSNKKSKINRLNFYILYKVGGPNDPRRQGYYNIKSRYYNHSSTANKKGIFTFNNEMKYDIISDFSEYDDISDYNSIYNNKKYGDTSRMLGNSIQVLNSIIHGDYRNLSNIPQRQKKDLVPRIIDTVCVVDLSVRETITDENKIIYPSVEVLYDGLGKINILKQFVDKTRYWSGERLKAQREYSPQRLTSQGYFDSEYDNTLSENFSRLTINSFGKSKLISFEKYLLKLK